MLYSKIKIQQRAPGRWSKKAANKGWISPQILSFSKFFDITQHTGSSRLLLRQPSKITWHSQGPSCRPSYFKRKKKLLYSFKTSIPFKLEPGFELHEDSNSLFQAGTIAGWSDHSATSIMMAIQPEDSSSSSSFPGPAVTQAGTVAQSLWHCDSGCS